jgi:hypothetical protein
MTCITVCCAALQAHQAYKAYVVAFLKALPADAVAKLLRLPEPSRMHMPCPAPTFDSKAQEASGSSSSSKACSHTAGFSDKARTLQLYSLAMQYKLSIEEARDKSGLSEYGRGNRISQLGQLCTGEVAPMDWEHLAAAAADADDDQLPLLAPPQQQQQQRCADKAAKAAGSAQPAASAAAASAAEFAAACSACCAAASSNGCGCSCACHEDVAQLVDLLPPTDVIVELLEQASEGTWLCNPRLLQQQHSSSCTLPRAGGAAAAGAHHSGPAAASGAAAGPQGQSPEAVMDSISSGWDVMDVLCEHGVDDASLSYAVERRIITAYHKVGVASILGAGGRI